MSVIKALLIYSAILGLIRGTEFTYNYFKDREQNKDNFIGAFLYRLILLPFMKFVIGIMATIFIKWMLSLFKVVTGNNLVYVGMFIMMDLVSMITVKRKEK